MHQVILFVLLLWNVTSTTVSRFLSYHRVSDKERNTSVVLLWKNQYYDMNFKEFPGGLHEATVKDLKEKCKMMTHVPIALMNLQVSGANIKDTTATLESVGIHKQAIVMLNGEETNKEDLQQVASGNAEEYGLMLRISGIINKQVTGLESQVVAWEKQVEAATTAGSHLSQDDKKKLQDMGNYFSEKMLQALITLDGVDCPFEFDTARQKRREGVRFTQQSLDRVDKVRSEIKCLAIE